MCVWVVCMNDTENGLQQCIIELEGGLQQQWKEHQICHLPKHAEFCRNFHQRSVGQWRSSNVTNERTVFFAKSMTQNAFHSEVVMSFSSKLSFTSAGEHKEFTCNQLQRCKRKIEQWTPCSRIDAMQGQLVSPLCSLITGNTVYVVCVTIQTFLQFVFRYSFNKL